MNSKVVGQKDSVLNQLCASAPGKCRVLGVIYKLSVPKPEAP